MNSVCINGCYLEETDHTIVSRLDILDELHQGIVKDHKRTRQSARKWLIIDLCVLEADIYSRAYCFFSVSRSSMEKGSSGFVHTEHVELFACNRLLL